MKKELIQLLKGKTRTFALCSQDVTRVNPSHDTQIKMLTQRKNQSNKRRENLL